MPRGNFVRGGILFVLLASSVLSCGERSATEPDLPTRIVAIPTSDIFVNSAQQEKRELLIDGRATDIEWEIAGAPTFALMRGSEGHGGDYFASVRAIWSYNPFDGDSVALYLLIQWPDLTAEFREQPLVTSVDWTDDDGKTLVNCDTSDPLHVEANWHKATELHEDQVEVEIYPDPTGLLSVTPTQPADRWRWGAATTDPVIPVSPTEIPTADTLETQGATLHPTGGFAEDQHNTGSGWVLDSGALTYFNNFFPGSNIPIFIAGKGTRDTRLNRAKPTALLIWKYVAELFYDPNTPGFAACDSLNPIRLDDASQRQKTWNPGDYVPSYVTQMPSGSQRDVVARGGWQLGKWSLEMRRLLESRDPDVGQSRGASHNDDLPLHSGHTYGLRIRIYNASKTKSSVSLILPLYIKPRS